MSLSDCFLAACSFYYRVKFKEIHFNGLLNLSYPNGERVDCDGAVSGVLIGRLESRVGTLTALIGRLDPRVGTLKPDSCLVWEFHLKNR